MKDNVRIELKTWCTLIKNVKTKFILSFNLIKELKLDEA